MEQLILTASDVDASITMLECIDVVEDAFARWGRGEVQDPAVLGVHVDGGGFHVKAAALRAGRHYFVAKTNGNFPGNPVSAGLPSIQGVIALCDADVGTPLALMDSIRVTEMRTAAATAVAARYLARPDSKAVSIVGCGAQARSQLLALREVLDFARVTAYDLDPETATRFAEAMAVELDLPVSAAADLPSAVGESDVCVTCTTATQAFLEADMIAPGTFVAAVGADSEHKHEISAALMASASVVVDSLAQCAEIGDLAHAVRAGAISGSDVVAELAQTVIGSAPGRSSPEEITLFDSTGTALQDVATAALVYERAVAHGRGLPVSLAE